MRLTIGDSTRISYSASGIYDAVRHIPRLRGTEAFMYK